MRNSCFSFLLQLVPAEKQMAKRLPSVLYGMTIRVKLVDVMSDSSLHSALHAIYLIAPIDSQLIRGPLIMARDECVSMGVCEMLLVLMSFEQQLWYPCRALFYWFGFVDEIDADSMRNTRAEPLSNKFKNKNNIDVTIHIGYNVLVIIIVCVQRPRTHHMLEFEILIPHDVSVALAATYTRCVDVHYAVAYVSCDWYLNWASWRRASFRRWDDTLGPRPKLITFLGIIIITFGVSAMRCDDWCSCDVTLRFVCLLIAKFIFDFTELANNNIFQAIWSYIAFITYVRKCDCAVVFLSGIRLIIRRHTHASCERVTIFQ